MTNGTINDVRPDTLPVGTIRVASNGDEWLVLLDVDALAVSHTCGGGGLPWTYTSKYEVFFTRGWQTCPRSQSCPAVNTTAEYRGSVFFDALDEAYAAFTRMEQELRA